MPSKNVDDADIGRIKLYKRRDNRSIKLTIMHDYVRVTLPYWVPYKLGIEFARNKSGWINANKRPVNTLKNNDKIGKYHNLKFIAASANSGAVAKINESTITVRYSRQFEISNKDVQSTAKRAVDRALRIESENLLPKRLTELASKNSYEYKSVKIRRLKSRWGSCSKDKDITLNLHLVQLPWQLIDYVLIHELAHTLHHNHSKVFWLQVHKALPNYKSYRAKLKQYKPYI